MKNLEWKHLYFSIALRCCIVYLFALVFLETLHEKKISSSKVTCYVSV